MKRWTDCSLRLPGARRADCYLLSVLHTALRGDQRRGLGCEVSGIFSSRRADNTNRRILQPRCYGRAHAVTECIVAVR